MTPPELTRRDVMIGAGAAAICAMAAPAIAGASVDRPEDFDATVATEWFDLALTLVQTTPGFSPPVAARALGYTGVTLYESVVRGSTEYESLGRVLPGFEPLAGGPRQQYWPAAANAALAAILRSLFASAETEGQSMIDDLEARFVAEFAADASPALLRRSADRGRRIAEALFELSLDDGGHEGYARNFPPDYVPPAGPGLWVPTPPGSQGALQPMWGTNRCLVLSDGASCPPGSPTPYSEHPDSAFFAEAAEVYEAVNGLTAEQDAIALFWSDDPGATVTPPGHSVSIATQALRREQASLMTAAETYAKVGIAVCDGFVACWNAKFRYNLLRPVTYIQALINPYWLPLLTTPPFPEYPSGHSVQSGAAFTVLTDLFGEAYAFDDHTHDDRGLPARHFDSFAAAAEEAAISRLYGGIHYRPAIELGLAQGRCIGEMINALPIRR